MVNTKALNTLYGNNVIIINNNSIIIINLLFKVECILMYTYIIYYCISP